MTAKVKRVVSVTILLSLMIYFGFKRERYLLVPDEHTVFKFLNKYPRIAATDFKKEMSGLVGFSMSPKLVSSILFSLIFLLLTSIIIHVLFANRSFTKLTAVLFIIYMVVCFLLIQIGNAGMDYRMSIGLSHYLEDLFLSPFPLMMLIPAFIIYRQWKKTGMSNK